MEIELRPKSETKCGNCNCCKPIDAQTGFQVDEGFERFRQKLDVFNRSTWDPEVMSEKARRFFEAYFTDKATFRQAAGFGHRDFALRNSSWYVADFTADMFVESKDRKEGFLDSYTELRPGATVKAEGTPKQNSLDVKRAAKFLGADMVGICEYDDRWVYSHNYSRETDREKPIDLPEDLPWVVVIANEMNREIMETFPSALSGAATGQGYSKDIIAVLSLAAFIRNLGYRAVATLNDTALSIPLAVQAGLGEYGRHGLLITPEHGPRVRIAKIFTDLPLTPDQPIDFGVKKFCEQCGLCAASCPPKAIPAGAPQQEPITVSNLKKVRKWTVDPEKCFKFWTSQGTDCAICIRVCPYNRDFKKPLNRLWLRLSNTPLRRLLLRIDKKLGHGKRKDPRTWWSKP
ncbi:MAG TPA: reductive dehalogenase [Fimbriimonas sp.]|nr:reductive dehalogenase [Fimbriimonas sp.]